jgi:hypothetical protein
MDKTSFIASLVYNVYSTRMQLLAPTVMEKVACVCFLSSAFGMQIKLVQGAQR